MDGTPQTRTIAITANARCAERLRFKFFPYTQRLYRVTPLAFGFNLWTERI
jgi:hypothetical protein